MPAPDLENMIRSSLEDLKRLYLRKLPVRVGVAVRDSVRFGSYFLLPGMILFFIFWLILHIAQITAFAKGLTPYPKWCWIFCPAFGMALTMLLKYFPETPLRNALTAGWISIGNLWMFGGLLVRLKKAEK